MSLAICANMLVGVRLYGLYRGIRCAVLSFVYARWRLTCLSCTGSTPYDISSNVLVCVCDVCVMMTTTIDGRTTYPSLVPPQHIDEAESGVERYYRDACAARIFPMSSFDREPNEPRATSRELASAVATGAAQAASRIRRWIRPRASAAPTTIAKQPH